MTTEHADYCCQWMHSPYGLPLLDCCTCGAASVDASVACPDCLHPASSHGYLEGCAWSYDLHAAEPPLCGCPGTQQGASHDLDAEPPAPCQKWLEYPREPQEMCPCGHRAAVHAQDVCSRCEEFRAYQRREEILRSAEGAPTRVVQAKAEPPKQQKATQAGEQRG